MTANIFFYFSETFHFLNNILESFDVFYLHFTTVICHFLYLTFYGLCFSHATEKLLNNNSETEKVEGLRITNNLCFQQFLQFRFTVMKVPLLSNLNKYCAFLLHV